jgi:hypothetical protein
MKKQNRRLVLNRETLVQLTDPEASRLAKGQGQGLSQFPRCTSPFCGPTVCECGIEK